MNYLKANNLNLEKKILEKSRNEEKMKKDFESLERQLKFYKDKLQIEILVNKNIVSAKKKISALNTINYEDCGRVDRNEKLVNNYKNTKTPMNDNEEILSVSVRKETNPFSEENEKNINAFDEFKTKSVINNKSPVKNYGLNISSVLNKNKITNNNILNLQVFKFK